MKWLANWLLIRGCNWLIPHAFYYSVRGPRIDERPPDVGPNNTWWSDFKPFADATSRLSWLNTDSKHICDLAILGLNDYLPWHAARICFQNQIDFNYLEARHLWEDADVTEDGLRIAGMHYKALIVEMQVPERAKPAVQMLEKAGRIIRWQEGQSADELLAAIARVVSMDVQVSPPNKDVRIRHVHKYGRDCYLCFNEGEEDITVEFKFSAQGESYLFDITSAAVRQIDLSLPLTMPAHHMHVIVLSEQTLES
jgi:hypothetical protein